MKRVSIFCISFFALLLTACNQGTDQPYINKILTELHDPTSGYVLVAAHRGDWRNYPENSLEAIRNVIEMGCDIVEIDIAMTADSVLILMHDRTINRTTTGKGGVKDITLDSIRNCRLKLQHGVASDYHIPTLEEVLNLCKDRIVINIDKGYDYYDQVIELTTKVGNTSQVLIKGSRKPDTVRQHMAGHTDNLLYMPVIDFRKSNAGELFDLYLSGEPPIAYEVVWDESTPDIEAHMKKITDSGSRLWTNSLWASLCGGLDDDRAYILGAEKIYGQHIKAGATIIQTDRPELLLDYLRSKKLHD